jgi:mRNA-degrading endonuclease RelE of RelBE toxin-antitoxin system
VRSFHSLKKSQSRVIWRPLQRAEPRSIEETFRRLKNGDMTWGLALTSPAKRQLRRLSQPERSEINNVFSLMCDNPFQGDIRFLRGVRGALRRRVGDFRIFYELHYDNKVIVVTAVKRRGSNTY